MKGGVKGIRYEIQFTPHDRGVDEILQKDLTSPARCGRNNAQVDMRYHSARPSVGQGRGTDEHLELKLSIIRHKTHDTSCSAENQLEIESTPISKPFLIGYHRAYMLCHHTSSTTMATLLILIKAHGRLFPNPAQIHLMTQ